MKVLYAHGFKSKPQTWVLECLKALDLQPFSLYIDYKNTPNRFELLKSYILKNEIQFLLGHSHGGFMVYYLAEMLGLPCLCFNPQLSLRAQKHVTPKIETRKCPIACIFLGEDDTAIYAQRTLRFLEKDKVNNPHKTISTKIIDGLGHKLDPDTFREGILWALEETKKLDL